MFGGKKEAHRKTGSSEINTLIGEGCTFEGNLNLPGATRIDGCVKGNVRSDSTLIVGDSGSIEGDIRCVNILIYGEVKGNIEAQRVELRQGAKLTGDIKTSVLIIEEGAVYNGHCSMGEPSGTSNVLEPPD